MTEKNTPTTYQETKILSMKERIKQATLAGLIGSVATLTFIIIEGSVFEDKFVESITNSMIMMVISFAVLFVIRFPGEKETEMKENIITSNNTNMNNGSTDILTDPSFSYLPGNIYHNSNSFDNNRPTSMNDESMDRFTNTRFSNMPSNIHYRS